MHAMNVAGLEKYINSAQKALDNEAVQRKRSNAIPRRLSICTTCSLSDPTDEEKIDLLALKVCASQTVRRDTCSNDRQELRKALFDGQEAGELDPSYGKALQVLPPAKAHQILGDLVEGYRCLNYGVTPTRPCQGQSLNDALFGA
ncbi:uncharacterized protein LAESUDRAFT_485300 [Laetiporus sulphureus 93-53]|nr:uncharacterized protein LAESUDRAFT_485300 [Laetiporus sulphureus 93-53]KZT01326.1 hypothetical protein LAESUDRAFT_485300 [Laetiporus sulphureus 93-53]